jgi:hypothetical protein
MKSYLLQSLSRPACTTLATAIAAPAGKTRAIRMHGHPEVPMQFLPTAKLWLQVEGPNGPFTAAVPLHR